MRREASLPTYCKAITALDAVFSAARVVLVIGAAAQAVLVPNIWLRTLLHLGALLNATIMVIGPLAAVALFLHRRYAPYMQVVSMALVVAVLLLGMTLNLVATPLSQRAAMLTGLAIAVFGVLTWVGLVSVSITKSLSFFRLIDAGHQATFDDLVAVGTSPQFDTLNLSGNIRVNDRFVARLRDHRNLTWLDLSHTMISDEAVRTLSWLRHLSDLNLSSTGVTDAILPQLAGMAPLRRLNLSRTRCTPAAVASFTALRQQEHLRPVEVRFDPAETDMPHAIAGPVIADEEFRTQSDVPSEDAALDNFLSGLP